MRQFTTNKKIMRDERLEHFNQKDQFRICSINNLKFRLEDSGFTVEVLKFGNAEKRDGLEHEETVIMAKK